MVFLDTLETHRAYIVCVNGKIFEGIDAHISIAMLNYVNLI